ncbi:MAG TPA: 23S rRNA (uracil(1939)-C(5))-methyltransferase RlmD, partial [Lachnospiraceae bacterium]|nr:23S rRNA (uracil(1939)-C(5))-methyltransferase RlmD [Lachnospiraceae bacterium]
MEYRKNQIIETVIEDISDNGEGIGKINGYTLFIKDTVIGDRVKARITMVKKNYGYARVEEILLPSADRTEPRCSLHRKCGGCNLQSMSYEAQLCYKQKKVREHLIRIGGFTPEFTDRIMEPIEGASDTYRYRNKEQYPVGYDNNRNIISGFYISRSHAIVECSDCYLGASENKIIVDILLKHFRKYKIEPYDEETGTGLIRHILIRKGACSGEIMVCIIVNGADAVTRSGSGSVKGSVNANSAGEKAEQIPFENELVKELIKVNGIRSICVNINNERTNVILGKRTITLWGSETIRDTLMNMVFEISPESFYQINHEQTEKLYGVIRAYADLSGKEEVWDICCGVGTIGLCLADMAKEVHGIEIVPEAIRNAEKNAALNNKENVEFICAAAEEYLQANRDRIQADVMILDPSRKGMDERALDAILTVKPGKIVYVSCDSATLARDLRYLCSNGYTLQRVRAVDMFPQTVHIETIV